MRFSPYTIVLLVLASHGLWAFLISIWNDFFAFGPMYFYLGGIFAMLPVIRLDFSRGFFCAVLSGCFLDASFSTPFGFHACGLAIAHVILHSTNERTAIRRRPTLILAALTTNFILFLSLHFWFYIQRPEGSEMLHARAIVDLLFSELLLVITLPWLIDLHDAFIHVLGLKRSDTPNYSS